MADARLPQLAINDRREATIQTLIAHFAEDRLTLEQLESRLDLVHRATTSAELDAITSDLPASAEATLPATPPVPVRPVATNVRENQVLVAVMGGVVRRGVWTPARKTFVLAMMGGADLDLREAVFGPGETEIIVFAFWGGVEIVLPPDVRVDAGGIAIMAGFDHQPGNFPDPGPDAPLVKVGGLAIMGGVEILVRYPGETAKDARRRVREEKKRLGKGKS